MKLNSFHIISRSIAYYRLNTLYQFLIILFLAAIITGSLLTGSSVKSSLKLENQNRLNGTGIVVSSGPRFFPGSLATRLERMSNERCEGILELKGWARNFNTSESALNVQLWGVSNSIFSYNNQSSTISLEKGEVAINSKLAKSIGLKIDDDIIIRTEAISDIPSGSPFAPEKDDFESLVLTVKHIIENDGLSDFSLEINQVRPNNIFIPIEELNELFEEAGNINRIIIQQSTSANADIIKESLRQVLTLSDAGLGIRFSDASGQFEIISKRIFIGENELNEVTITFPESKPVITWLANSFTLKDKSTPYSFITALPEKYFGKIPGENEILINIWLSEDLEAVTGDTLTLSYYTSTGYKNLIENYKSFVIRDVVDPDSIWSDQTLMPEFPGISGSESCSSWDAGVPVDMDKIREKDEKYWDDFKGTPKAFISYKAGLNLWGNNFGPATAIRFPENVTDKEINRKLTGQIDPFISGFRVVNIYKNSILAAQKSVDFSTLFISLSFFIILSSLVLLVLLISTHIEARRTQISTLTALGFKNSDVIKLFLLESGVVAFFGSLAGIFAGTIFNNIVIRSLNSVWIGAVQTNTLSPFIDSNSMILGFLISFLMVMLVIYLNLRKRLKLSVSKQKTGRITFSGKLTKPVLYIFALITLTSFLFRPGSATISWFISGVLLFITLLLFILFILSSKFKKNLNLSWSYYKYYPLRAVTPILFLAAGLFIVIITGANRKSFNADTSTRESGTGGYLLWGETSTPLLYDLNSQKGRDEYDISANKSDLSFVQIKRNDGNDASCLNLNSIASPPLLGLDPSYFSGNGAFSFASELKDLELDNPWDALNLRPGEQTIYGIVDQTVLQWSLYKKVGDTLVFATENGETLNVIVSAGLKSSVFQGNILIGQDNFNYFYPSVSGSNIFLLDGNIDSIDVYKELLEDKLSRFGSEISFTYNRLAAFNEVTNTYLTVFMTLGGLGMIMGVLGMGFVVLRNFDYRRKEYAMQLVSGFSPRSIRNSVFWENLIIFLAGVLVGCIPAPVATFPSLMSDAQVPIGLMLAIIAIVLIVGFFTIRVLVNRLINSTLITSLRKN
ncbi:MAG: ABC transporter permease [Bacteroidales bacterium]|nr:ABC transporter permease [Bacteroidales bacterium]